MTRVREGEFPNLSIPSEKILENGKIPEVTDTDLGLR